MLSHLNVVLVEQLASCRLILRGRYILTEYFMWFEDFYSCEGCNRIS